MTKTLLYVVITAVLLPSTSVNALCLPPDSRSGTTDWIEYSICLSEENKALIQNLSRDVNFNQGNSINNMQQSEKIEQMSSQIIELESDLDELRELYEILLEDASEQSSRIYYLEEAQAD